MAKMNSKFKYMYDAAPAIALAANDGVAVTATANGTTYALDQLDGYWNVEDELADQTFAVVLNVEAAETGAACSSLIGCFKLNDSILIKAISRPARGSG